jgi:hypothetical protein
VEPPLTRTGLIGPTGTSKGVARYPLHAALVAHVVDGTYSGDASGPNCTVTWASSRGKLPTIGSGTTQFCTPGARPAPTIRTTDPGTTPGAPLAPLVKLEPVITGPGSRAVKENVTGVRDACEAVTTIDPLCFQR